MDETPIEAVQQYVEGLEWPCTKEEVLEAVERNGAPDDVLQALRGAEKDRFAGPNDVHSVLWKQA
ncbi:MAG: DUF2795 domain-containing protein [Actinobacteria bacterium]|nr:DUF2795 domain-containing protein [Actinomycetota bacterium]